MGRFRSTRTSPPAPTTRAPTPRAWTATTRAIRPASSGCRTATASAASSPRSARPSIPEVGFLRRTNFEKTLPVAALQPAAQEHRVGAQVHPEGTLDYFVNGNGAVETRTQTGRFNTEFESSDQVTVEASDNYEALFVPFNVGGGVFIPAGGYNFRDATVVLRDRAAAPLHRHRRAAGRRVLRRHDHRPDAQHRALCDPEAVLGRAERVDQPDRSALRRVHDRSCTAPAATTRSRRGCS